jgi:hypothetical protein
MAKVTGPLFSMSAAGKVGNAIVHFGWKGIAVVRQWVKPSNPMSEKQGDVRQILGGLGRATRCINKNGAYGIDALAVTASGKTYVSQFVKDIVDNYMNTRTLFEAEYSAYAGHAQKATFDSEAATLGLTTFDVTYKGATHAFVPGLQLYELAKYGILKQGASLGAFDRTPYTVAIGSWSSGNVTAMGLELLGD